MLRLWFLQLKLNVVMIVLCNEWGIEKLLFRDVKRGIRRDQKYALHERSVYATGVHLSQNLIGKTYNKLDGKIRFYHYHNTISSRGDPCTEWVNPSMENNVTLLGGTPYVYDGSIKAIAPLIKQFEWLMIGSQLVSTSL